MNASSYISKTLSPKYSHHCSNQYASQLTFNKKVIQLHDWQPSSALGWVCSPMRSQKWQFCVPGTTRLTLDQNGVTGARWRCTCLMVLTTSAITSSCDATSVCLLHVNISNPVWGGVACGSIVQTLSNSNTYIHTHTHQCGSAQWPT